MDSRFHQAICQIVPLQLYKNGFGIKLHKKFDMPLKQRNQNAVRDTISDNENNKHSFTCIYIYIYIYIYKVASVTVEAVKKPDCTLAVE